MNTNPASGCFLIVLSLVHHIFNWGFHIMSGSTRFNADEGIVDALVHLRKKREAGGEEKQLPESQSWGRRFGACFTLTMPGLFRDHPSS